MIENLEREEYCALRGVACEKIKENTRVMTAYYDVWLLFEDFF